MATTNNFSIRPFLFVVGVAVVMLFGCLWAWTRSDDAHSKEREQALVANGIAARIGEIENAAAAELVWDEAVENLDNHFSAEWAQANVASYFLQQNQFELSYIIDHADRVVFGSEDGASGKPEDFTRYAGAVASLVRAVRAREAARPPLKPSPDGVTMVTKPVQASAIARVGDRLTIFTASLVDPDFGKAMPLHAQAPIVVTGEAINDDFLAMLAGRFMLQNLRVGSAGSAQQRKAATIPLRDAAGAEIATLVWTPQRPGAALFAKALTPILGLLFGFGCLSTYLFLRARHSADNLLESEARARYMALHDGLTGLANRTLMADRYRQAAADLSRGRAQAIAVLCLDLDKFKDVNDTLGHHCGDELLVEVSRRLTQACRSNDTLARLGGDEFVIIQSDATARSAAAHADRLISLLSGPVTLSGGEAFLSCSVGVALIADGAVGADEALRQADLALYRAKEAGRRQYAFFEPGLDADSKARRKMEADLREAVAAGALHMVYQPQVDRHAQIVGVEALVRWTHPEAGPIGPATFIPLAEECGLIDAIGWFTMRQAFADSLRWPNLKVAVNVSAKQLANPHFPERIEAVLGETGADPAQLELEMTEGVLIQNDETTLGTLRRLRALGFSLALDDFGTGYSSLNYLRLYPIDKIKIDRSFVVGLDDGPSAEALVRAIVELSRAMGMNVIAEGVETQEQHLRLAAIGCPDAQGFLFSRPVGAEAIDAMVTPSEAVHCAA